MKEIVLKAVIYCVLAVVILIVAMQTADCYEVSRILYDKGNSNAGQTARVYFLTLMGIAVIIVQNFFIRLALYAKDQSPDNTGPEGEKRHVKMIKPPNKITGPNAGGPRQFPIRTPLAARVGQFCRWGGMRALAVISILAMSGALLAQVVLTPVNQRALIMGGNTNAFSLSNATQIVSALRLGMAQTNVDSYLNAHGMTNRFGLSLDRGQHTTLYYDFPGTDRTLVLETRSRRTGPRLFDWGDPVLESGRIQKLGVDTFLLTFTNAP